MAMIRELERGETGRIRLGGDFSNMRKHKGGLGQGGRLPPIRWGFGLNPLLVELEGAGGTEIQDTAGRKHKIAAEAFMVDVNGLEESARKVGEAIKRAEAWADKTMTKISPEKTQILCMGKREVGIGQR